MAWWFNGRKVTAWKARLIQPGAAPRGIESRGYIRRPKIH